MIFAWLGYPFTEHDSYSVSGDSKTVSKQFLELPFPLDKKSIFYEKELKQLKLVYHHNMMLLSTVEKRP